MNNLTEQTLIEMLDNLFKIQKLLDEQKSKAEFAFTNAKLGAFTSAELLRLELISTASDRLATEQKWLKNSLVRAAENI